MFLEKMKSIEQRGLKKKEYLVTLEKVEEPIIPEQSVKASMPEPSVEASMPKPVVKVEVPKPQPKAEEHELHFLSISVLIDLVKLHPIAVRIIFLFSLVVVGILANWFWTIGWAYLANPSKGLLMGTPLAIIIRVVLSFIAALLTFVPTYNKINQSSSESWLPYVLAFQNGFFWQAAFDSIMKQFQA